MAATGILASPFLFNDTATTEIYTLSLHDALPIYHGEGQRWNRSPGNLYSKPQQVEVDRKSTRLNSSHLVISYAAFCLKTRTTVTTGATRLPPATPHAPLTGHPAAARRLYPYSNLRILRCSAMIALFFFFFFF